MKKIFAFGILLLIVVGCQIKTTNNNESIGGDTKDNNSIFIKEIPLTYDDVAGKIDMTKNFYFIFDQSGSMRESCSGQRKIDGAKTAITNFMGNILGDVNIGLMVIGCDNNSEIAELLPLALATPEYKKKFNDNVASMLPSQGTPLVQAIKLAVDKMVVQKKLQLGYGEYRIVIVSDGEATDGDLEQSAMYAMQYAIGIYSIGLCMSRSHPLKEFSVKYFDADNYDQLKTALESVTSEVELFNATDYDSTAYSQ